MLPKIYVEHFGILKSYLQKRFTLQTHEPLPKTESVIIIKISAMEEKNFKNQEE